MLIRFSAASGAALVAVALAACSSPGLTAASTASVKVNGVEAVRTDHVTCSKVQWLLMIDIADKTRGARLLLDESGEVPSSKAVHIDNLGGFSGMYSEGDGGSAHLTLGGGRFTISGVADGFNTDSNEPASAKYEITAKC